MLSWLVNVPIRGYFFEVTRARKAGECFQPSLRESALLFCLGLLSNSATSRVHAVRRRDRAGQTFCASAGNPFSACVFRLFSQCVMAGQLAVSSLSATIFPGRVSAQPLWRTLFPLRFAKMGSDPIGKHCLSTAFSAWLDRRDRVGLTCTKLTCSEAAPLIDEFSGKKAAGRLA